MKENSQKRVHVVTFLCARSDATGKDLRHRQMGEGKNQTKGVTDDSA